MRTPSWIDQLPRILNALQAQPTYSRRDVQAIFSIGKSAAVELMRVAGAIPGPVPTVSRAALLAYVELCPASQEIARRRKLANRLKAAEEELRLRKVKIPGMTPSDEWTRWRDLPNVSIAKGVLQIAFEDQQELLHTLMLVAKAMANEQGEFEKMCASPGKLHEHAPSAERVSQG